MTTTICDFHFYDRALIAQIIAAHGDPSSDPYFTWPLSFKDTGYMLLHAHDIAASLTVVNAGLLFGSDMVPFADAFGIFYPLSATYIAESVIVQATKEGPRFYLTLTADGGNPNSTTQTRLCRRRSAHSTGKRAHHSRLGEAAHRRLQSACRYRLLEGNTL